MCVGDPHADLVALVLLTESGNENSIENEKYNS